MKKIISLLLAILIISVPMIGALTASAEINLSDWAIIEGDWSITESGLEGEHDVNKNALNAVMYTGNTNIAGFHAEFTFTTGDFTQDTWSSVGTFSFFADENGKNGITIQWNKWGLSVRDSSATPTKFIAMPAHHDWAANTEYTIKMDANPNGGAAFINLYDAAGNTVAESGIFDLSSVDVAFTQASGRFVLGMGTDYGTGEGCFKSVIIEPYGGQRVEYVFSQYYKEPTVFDNFGVVTNGEWNITKQGLEPKFALEDTFFNELALTAKGKTNGFHAEFTFTTGDFTQDTWSSVGTFSFFADENGKNGITIQWNKWGLSVRDSSATPTKFIAMPAHHDWAANTEYTIKMDANPNGGAAFINLYDVAGNTVAESGIFDLSSVDATFTQADGYFALGMGSDYGTGSGCFKSVTVSPYGGETYTYNFADYYVSQIAGDANADGEFNILDLVCLKKYLVQMECEINLDLADIDKDGSVIIDDLIAIRRMLIGIN